MIVCHDHFGLAIRNVVADAGMSKQVHCCRFPKMTIPQTMISESCRAIPLLTLPETISGSMQPMQI